MDTNENDAIQEDSEVMMGFLKWILAFFVMAFFAIEISGLSADSKEVFIGFCILLAGMIAHSEK